MMNRFKKTKYPNLKLVVYNKGLSKVHVVTLQKMCNCDVRYFPFETYPVHMRHSRCFAQKPIIIQTVLHEHDFIMCLDTSIRLRNVDPYFQKAKRYGIQVIQGLGSISVRTHSRLFDTLHRRFDQSVLGIILTRLFNDRRHQLIAGPDFAHVCRGCI